MVAVVLLATVLSGASFLLWALAGPNPVSSRVLGIRSVSPNRMATTIPITFSSTGAGFTPRAAVIAIGGAVTFVNSSAARLDIRSAGLSPAHFSLSVGPHTRASLRLPRSGLYHYFDAVSTRTLRVVAGNEVVVNRLRSRLPSEGWIAVLSTLPGLETHLNIPDGQGVFTSKVLVTVVGPTVTVSNHDQVAHNIVIDPHSPSGAVFIPHGGGRHQHSQERRGAKIGEITGLLRRSGFA
jgi:hypothetical protein